MKKKAIATILALSLVATSVTVPPDGTTAEELPKSYMVMAKNDTGYDKAANLYGEDEAPQSGELEENHVLVAEMTSREAEQLEKDKNILLVEENITLEGSDTKKEGTGEIFDAEVAGFLATMNATVDSIDPEEQWNIDVINANQQEYEQGEERVKVAVMDTGVVASADIPVADRVNFVEGEEDVEPLFEDISGHGTSIASIIAAKDNGDGVTGVNPNVSLYSVKVLDDEKRANLSTIVQGIYWCIDHDMDIINMSFGTSVQSDILAKAIKDADEAGILIVAAAGNQGEQNGEVEYPAAYEEVLAVGASNPQGEISEFSSVGKEIDLMAPGEKIPATGFFDEIIETEGTSMAAPHVTGVASILWAKDTTKSNEFIKALLRASAKPMEGQTGAGMVDLNYALSIYDSFADSYEEDAKAAEEEVSTNTEAIESFDDAEVEASWHYTEHENMISEYDGETSDTVISIMKIGCKLADQASYLKYNHGETDSFHGYYNFIGNYMYLMRIARICFNKSFSEALSTAEFPFEISDEEDYEVLNPKEQIQKGLKEINKHWSTILSGYTINDKNKARVIVGLALHVAMDTYSHRAYKKDSSGNWTVRITKYQDANNNGNPDDDDIAYIPERYTCAKNVAFDIIDVWHYALTPDALEFYQDAHNKNKFRLGKFGKYVKRADPDTNEAHPNWYYNRTNDE